MTATESAKIIGCTPQAVRWMIRNKKMKAKKVQTVFGDAWDVTQKEAERVRDNPEPLGRPRKGSK